MGKTGLYAEGVALLKSIDSKQLSRDQLIEYYITFEDIYLYHAEYAMDDEYQIEYLNNLYIYRDSVLQMVEGGVLSVCHSLYSRTSATRKRRGSH